jgi:hypothetical protein
MQSWAGGVDLGRPPAGIGLPVDREGQGLAGIRDGSSGQKVAGAEMGWGFLVLVFLAWLQIVS